MRSIPTLVLALGLASACKPSSPSNETSGGTPTPAPTASGQPLQPATQPVRTPTSAATGQPGGDWTGGVVKRGAPLTEATPTELASVLKTPADFNGKTVKTEGKVAKACSKKGCWMELQTASGEGGVRVTFKDYAFFVPLDSEGAKAVVEGTVELKTLSKEDAEHLEAEGAKITRNAKGEATELALVATGVELARAN